MPDHPLGAFFLTVSKNICMQQFEIMKLNYDKQTGRTSNRHGIHTRISEFGSIDKFAYLDSTKLFIPYYTDLINRLIEEDYIPGLSLKAAPYDFRKAPCKLLKLFKKCQGHGKNIKNSYAAFY